jgi:hypothetical protein
MRGQIHAEKLNLSFYTQVKDQIHSFICQYSRDISSTYREVKFIFLYASKRSNTCREVKIYLFMRKWKIKYILLSVSTHVIYQIHTEKLNLSFYAQVKDQIHSFICQYSRDISNTYREVKFIFLYASERSNTCREVKFIFLCASERSNTFFYLSVLTWYIKYIQRS